MIPVEAGHCADYVLVLRRNNSFSPSDRQWAFRLFCIISVLIGLGFTAFGAWPVFPFAGLEMAALYVAFRYVDRHASDYECLEIKGDCLRIETRVGSEVRCVEFNRHWAQVAVSDGPGRRRLAIRSHGREVELGRHLTSEDRERVARELRQQLRNAS